MAGWMQDNGISFQFVSLPLRIETSYPVSSSSLLSDISLLWGMRRISKLKPLLSHFFLKEITILAAVRLLGGMRTSTGASHAWLTPCPGRRHSSRIHQLSRHLDRDLPQVPCAIQSLRHPGIYVFRQLLSCFCASAGGRNTRQVP